MSNLKGVILKSGLPANNVLLAGDGTSALVVSAKSTASLAINVVKEINSLKDAEDLGLTSSYDSSNNINVYRHISEFYRIKGGRGKLYIMLADQTKSLSEIIENISKKVLIAADGEIRQIAFATNLPAGTAITHLDGITNGVHQAISKAQGLANWAAENQMECQVFLEAHNYLGTASSSGDLRKINNVEAPNVSLFIGQDYDHAAKRQGLSQKYADIGTLLGVTALANVHQNVGNNELYNLSGDGQWITPGLSSHQSNKEAFNDLQTLENKGYLFGLKYTGLSGVRINNDHTCIAVKLDSNNVTNQNTIALGRVVGKARRGLRSVYMPKIKTDWLLDNKGKLAPASVITLEDIGDKVFELMISRGEISYGKTKIDKTSDLITAKTLKMSYTLIPNGAINEINGTITLKTTT